MREELSELIRFEMADPRLAGVDVTEVHCSPDLKRADVLVSAPREGVEGALEGLVHAKGFLRYQLMRRMDLYRTPELRFLPDAETSLAVPSSRIIRRIRRGRMS